MTSPTTTWRNPLRTASALLLAASVVLCCAQARALEDYADEIQRELELRDKPSCTFCHSRNERWVAADTLFNDALKDRGFSRRMGLPSLRRALATLDELNIDSDGDGVGDVDELRAGANPNDERDAGIAPTGCSIARVGARPRTSAVWLCSVFAWFWLRRWFMHTSMRTSNRG